MHPDKKQMNFLTIVVVAIACVLTGGIIGAVTNLINGRVIPYYYQAVMYWDFKDIRTAAVGQGILEGLLYGVMFSLIFTTTFGLITKGQGTFKFAFKQLIKLTTLVFICWTIGGLIAMFLATLSPDFYKWNFPQAPIGKSEMIKFAWVGGSIWGGMIGGLISACMGIVLLKNNWRQLQVVNSGTH
jgi:prolipoprotein diacylglyceryltransferase